MAEYISKQVRIQAVQLNYKSWNDVCELLGDAISPLNPGYYIKPGEESDACGERGDGEGFLAVNVTTMHGETAVVRHGDYIIPDGRPGTFYPCKPEVFKAKYEPAPLNDFDALAKQWAVLQELLEKSIPVKYSFDLDKLTHAMLATDNGKLTKEQLMDMFLKTGALTIKAATPLA